LAAHKRVGNEPGKTTICDALMAAMPGELTFAINGRLLAGGFAVSDREVQAAMAYAFRNLKLVVEPGGAVALAAVLAGKIDPRGGGVWAAPIPRPGRAANSRRRFPSWSSRRDSRGRLATNRCAGIVLRRR